jgi:hypothetical protein
MSRWSDPARMSVAVYLENRLDGLILAILALYQRLSALGNNYSQAAISLTCRLTDRKWKIKKMNPWKRRQVT